MGNGFDFGGKVALVTGAARGMGLAIARAFAAAGAAVYLVDVQDEVGQMEAKRLREEGADASYLHLDVGAEEDWQAAVAAVEGERGRLDVLVNCAGILGGGRIEHLDLAEHLRVQRVNSDGVFLGMKTALPLLRRRGADEPYASVVNISSIGALRGNTGGFSYNVSKAAVLSMTKTAAIEWAAFGYPVRVNAVLPGATMTEMSTSTFAHMRDPERREKAMRKAIETIAARHPLRRLAEADEMAHAVLYLSSPGAGFVTGTELIVDGGLTAEL